MLKLSVEKGGGGVDKGGWNQTLECVREGVGVKEVIVSPFRLSMQF